MHLCRQSPVQPHAARQVQEDANDQRPPLWFLVEPLELDHETDAVDEALRAAHLREWSRWLAALSLEQQLVDVIEFLDGLNARLVIQSWEPDGHPWDLVIPQAAPRAERTLFAANFRTLLVLLRVRFA